MKYRLIGKGGNKNTGGGSGYSKPSMKRTKSAPPIGESEETELEETSSMAAGDVQGAMVGRGRKKPVSPFEDLDVEKENEEERKRSHTIKDQSLTEEDELVEEIVNYLLGQSGVK